MLSETNFRHSYSSGYEEPKEFFTEALIESCSFDLGLGFFSSSGIRSLAYGFALFIANNGRMRVIINNILSETDKAAISKGEQEDYGEIEANIISDIKRLKAALSREDELFFKCLSYLVATKRIEFVATVSAKGGLGHDKYGIFTDRNGYKVAFIGSANFSQSALELNGETITVFTEEEDRKRVQEYQNLFEQSWQKDTPHLKHIPLERVKTFIASEFESPALSELMRMGVDAREIAKRDIKTKPLSERLMEKIEEKESEPRFPFAEERNIQKEAYRAWIENGRCGIFAMATGAGKTVTSLNCVLRQFYETHYYKVIIAVPTQALALQWKHEAEAFNFQNIICTLTDRDWKERLARYTTQSMLRRDKNIVLITTYATFNRSSIQNFLSSIKGIESFIYIADEAHNLGARNSLAGLPNMIKNRIGLSATPERIYDDAGSEALYDFFNSKPPYYTYRYTMMQAINDEILCHYDYYPIFVSLTDSEMEEYRAITDKLRKFIDTETGLFKEGAEKLLLIRKQIIHKAENKKRAIISLLDSLENKNGLDYTFVFVPEGYEPDYMKSDSYDIDKGDIHLIDEYARIFRERGYSYHKYISGIDDAPEILESFARGDIKVLLSMKCLDEGVDIPRAEHAIFCSSTGNPRQFVQRRGRVLRRCKWKEKATIWDLVVMPYDYDGDAGNVERNLFANEVRRVVNFAALADNDVEILYGELSRICESMRIDMFAMLEKEYEKYN